MPLDKFREDNFFSEFSTKCNIQLSNEIDISTIVKVDKQLVIRGLHYC